MLIYFYSLQCWFSSHGPEMFLLDSSRPLDWMDFKTVAGAAARRPLELGDSATGRKRVSPDTGIASVYVIRFS